MKMIINNLHLKNFKGCKEKTVEFGGNAKVLGANSAGKSTLFCAWMWLMAGVNEHLVSNPNITPYGESECESVVEAELTIDGKPCRISKSQKYKEKIDDSGKTVSSTLNSYTINGVEKSATSFVTEMKERGVDMDKFLMLSHVFAFTTDTSKKGREEMRKVLFEMVKDISDLDIAKEMSGIAELTIELGKGYKVEEVEQMAKQSLKKLNDTYGKSGELIDAKISGLIEGKAEVNETGIVEREMDIKEQIKQTEAEIAELNSGNTKVRIMELENKLREVEAKAKEEFYKERQEHIDKHNVIIDKYRDVETVINTANKVIFENEKEIENCNTLLESLRIDYDAVFKKQYEGSSNCPVCKQELPKLMLADAKANFEADKARNLSSIQSAAARVHRDIDDKEKLIADAKETISRVTPSLEMLKGQLEEWEKVSITEPRLEDIPEAVSLQTEISSLRAETTNSSDMKLQGLNEYLESLKNDLRTIDGDYKSIENNRIIDEKVSDLRDQKKSVEIQRANHEKMIYEVETFKKFKNNKLSDEINSHFNIAQFRLYRVLKNGSIEDDCAILVNGKELNSQLNQSTQILALTDVIAGLQTYKDQELPVFLDDHALFTSENDKAIPLKCQTIKLIAAEGVNDLTIEKGE